MQGQDNHDRFTSRHPHPHVPFFRRPHWTRRRFFEMAGAGITAAFLGERYARAAETVTAAGVTTRFTSGAATTKSTPVALPGTVTVRDAALE